MFSLPVQTTSNQPTSRGHVGGLEREAMGDVLVWQLWLKSQGGNAAAIVETERDHVTWGGYSIFEFQILSEEVSTVDLNSGDQL